MEEYHLWDKAKLVKELEDWIHENNYLRDKLKKTTEYYNTKIAHLDARNNELLKVLTQRMALDIEPIYFCHGCGEKIVIKQQKENEKEE